MFEDGRGRVPGILQRWLNGDIFLAMAGRAMVQWMGDRPLKPFMKTSINSDHVHRRQ